MIDFVSFVLLSLSVRILSQINVQMLTSATRIAPNAFLPTCKYYYFYSLS